MRRVIFTGDDFGASEAINEAIERAHIDGILTTASLMVGGAAATDAVRRARRLPSLNVGLHVVVARGRAVLPWREIPDLVDRAGNFSDRLARSGINLFFRPAVRRQLEAEIRAQFEAFQATGLRLDHVNAHNHQQLHPTVLALILKVGRRYGLSAVRVPYEPPVPSWRAGGSGLFKRALPALFLSPWIGLMRRRLRAAGVACNDYVFGLNDSGRMSTERLLAVLARLPQGISEVYFHPTTASGMDPEQHVWRHASAGELEALTHPAVRAALNASDIRSVSYSDLSAGSL